MPLSGLFQKGMNGLAINPVKIGLYTGMEKKEKRLNVSGVRLNGILRQASFRDYIMKKEVVQGGKLCGQNRRIDGIQGQRVGSMDKMPAMEGILSAGSSDCLANTVEFAEFPACFCLLATFLHTRFLVVFTTLQFSFNSVYLQLFLQLSDGVFKVPPNFNFYHLWLRLTN